MRRRPGGKPNAGRRRRYLRSGRGGSDADPGVETFEVESATHTTDPVDYPQDPPVGGPHDPSWQKCAVYDAPVRPENAVHSLEHGAVWITYQPDLPESDREILAKLAEGQPYLLISPYPDSRIRSSRRPGARSFAWTT